MGNGHDKFQDFIFKRELAEVYLLLDHLSGRPNKSLATAVADYDEKNEDPNKKTLIEKICEIGWPPQGTVVEQAAQAATLLMAKDRLNASANPASGASIAFTLLVAGDDEQKQFQRAEYRKAGRWWRMLVPFWGSLKSQKSRAEPAENLNVKPLAGGNGEPPPPPAPPSHSVWGGEPPSRTSLARLAYPGLVSTAAHFKVGIDLILLFLVGWLVITCLLSWNIAAGHAILVRLDSLQIAKTAIVKKIADAENEDAKRSAGDPGRDAASSAQAAASVTPGRTTTPNVVAPAKPVVRFCDRRLLLPPQEIANSKKIEMFNDVTQRQICDDFAENLYNFKTSGENLADWLAAWRWLKAISHWICGGDGCTSDKTVATPIPADTIPNDQQWAAVLLEVLASAVLPIFYGFLGAGAAVVRDIWSKMKDSMLAPRDFTLALGQLALGAVIGACIGLFVTPSGTNGQAAVALTGSVTLTPSALSFIAGFGVEGVFVALESFIKRVFNVPDPSR